MRTNMFLAAGVLSALTMLPTARAGTIATFADPSTGAVPLFSYTSGLLTGGWAGTGLTLETPWLAAPDYTDATFSLGAPLTTVLDLGIAKLMSGGQINFFDSGGAPLLTITFSSAVLSNSLSLGGSDFAANNVLFSGPLLGGQSYQNEAFAFSFANPAGLGSNFTVTSAFTSSADILLPAPGAAVLLGLGGVVAARRRRR